MLDWFPFFAWRDGLDIVLVAAFVWLAIRYFRQTRARPALAGLALLAVVNFVAQGLDLRLSAAIFQGFFAVLVLVLVVVFQEDLRRVFERLGSWWSGHSRAVETDSVDLLVRTIARLAASRVGALVVLPGEEPLERHLEGGVVLGGRVSEPLLLSLFDASSPGHDGAVLVRGDVVERFAVHLPLSANHAALGPGGTRHAAALGLAERCDATCIVVSEERGTISVAHDGRLWTLGRPEDLVEALRSPDTEASGGGRWWQGQVRRDTALAAATAIAAWLVFVPGSDSSEVEVIARVDARNLPAELALVSSEPETVAVTLRGLRRDLVLLEPEDVSVEVDAYLARLGRRTFSLGTEDVRGAGRLSPVSLDPKRVRLSLAPISAERSAP